jgi:hypothetical protein
METTPRAETVTSFASSISSLESFGGFLAQVGAGFFGVSGALGRAHARFLVRLRSSLKHFLAPYLLKERDAEKFQAQDIRAARFWEIAEGSAALAQALARMLLYAAPVFFLFDAVVLTPLLEGEVVSSHSRMAAAILAALLCMAALHEWRKIQSAVHAVAHGPLSTDTGLEVHLKLAEARSFETGHGRIKSAKAACERFFKVLQMPPESELTYSHLPAALIGALHGALRTCRAFPHPTRRYESFAAVVTRHERRLFRHRISGEILERMLEDYIAASRSDYPCDANALLLCARSAEGILREDPLFRDRIASIALRESAMLPKSFDIERINALLAALSVLDMADGALPYIEQALLNEVVNLSDTSRRGLLIAYLLNHPKVSIGARAVLEGALKHLDDSKRTYEDSLGGRNIETIPMLGLAA